MSDLAKIKVPALASDLAIRKTSDLSNRIVILAESSLKKNPKVCELVENRRESLDDPRRFYLVQLQKSSWVDRKFCYDTSSHVPVSSKP